MELLKERLQITKTCFRETTIAYSDGDIIVPDVKPDILKIIQVDAISFITSKEISDGFIKLSGRIKYNILYIPDCEGESVKSISSEMPFSHTIDKKQIPADSVLDVSSNIERVEFTLLNSRKLNIKTAVLISYSVLENKEVSLAKGLDNENAETVFETINTEKLTAFSDSIFTIRDRLEIPSGRAPVTDILKLDINICDKEVKAITGKAVIKGNILLCALYLDANGEINSVNAEIPFTEIAEIFDLEEDTPCTIEYRLNDYFFDAANDDAEVRAINFEVSVEAVVSAYKTEEVKIMKDCFCPGFSADMIYDTVSLEDIVSSGTNQYTIKEIIAPDKNLPPMASVYNVVTRPFITKATPSNEKILIEGRLDAYILYITDNVQFPVYSFKKEIPLSFSIENEYAKEGLEISADICVAHTTFNLNMANEVELRCNLLVDTKLSKRGTFEIISDCTLSEIKNNCGIVIYFVQPGDSLWKIAKNYSVSVADILKYNDIPDENSIDIGKRLVIPLC